LTDESVVRPAGPLQEIFSRIYRDKEWGTGAGEGDFHSGSGSHDPALTGGYVAAVRQFIATLGAGTTVVDLGCGDFVIGSQLRDVCGKYVACDVVPELIERNRRVFRSLDVDFRHLDITEDELPDGDVAILRLVLQHLGNAEIARIVPRLRKYRYLVLTEHLPAAPHFPPNADMQTGPGIRLPGGSGVVLTAAPFLMPTFGERPLHAALHMGGRLATDVHALQQPAQNLRYTGQVHTFAAGPAATGVRPAQQGDDLDLRRRQLMQLAQYYRARGDRRRALDTYTARAELGGTGDEVFVSLYHAAQLRQELGHPREEVIATYLRATDACPTRAEALHGASRLCRYDGQFEDGYRIGKRGIDVPAPAAGLGIESWIYAYGMLDEFAVNAYLSGHFRESFDASARILAREGLDAALRTRVEANLRFARDKLEAGSVPAMAASPEHALEPPRDLHARVDGSPRVLLAILAKQKEPVLPFYLQCIEALDYPKSSICLYIRTNNNTDRTAAILTEWVARVGSQYAQVEMDDSDVAAKVEQYAVHEWNAVRFRTLGTIRQASMNAATAAGCAYYFVVDVDNFVRPCTLRELVALDLPIVAPLLRHVDPLSPYSNFHAAIDGDGYYVDSDNYLPLLRRTVKGICEVPVVHCTYLVRADMIPRLEYLDDTPRHEYVVFSHSARRNGIQQYLDTRQIYGYLTLDENPAPARALLGGEVGAHRPPTS